MIRVRGRRSWIVRRGVSGGALTGTSAEEFWDGRAWRARIPRGTHGDWAPAQDRPDPIEVLTASVAGHLAELIPIRFGRIAASPFAFPRGSVAVMAADLSRVPTTGIEVKLCRGLPPAELRLLRHSPERNVVFGLSDFD
jgi:hypothetical protein